MIQKARASRGRKGGERADTSWNLLEQPRIGGPPASSSLEASSAAAPAARSSKKRAAAAAEKRRRDARRTVAMRWVVAASARMRPPLRCPDWQTNGRGSGHKMGRIALLAPAPILPPGLLLCSPLRLRRAAAWRPAVAGGTWRRGVEGWRPGGWRSRPPPPAAVPPPAA